ncbi:cytochrome c biogenesis protein CcsA [Deminuibacter soli]|uniref:Cytochrome c assembly protein n=1 Tax=Deminuibacter soli TaxID=2291815 RepID=A0A3E1NJ75_9BACT|nr:cytochrome c biogenesis protein CcsA [Deminuibacter soli]RFM27985.1 cytochrome c assembly protein [Deminuibacter soli]
MNYIGEHLLPGQLGHFFAVLALVAAVIATIAYFKANREKIPADKASWLRLARAAFIIESIAVAGTFITLFYIVSNHYSEYFFAWNHSSRSLQPQYLLACIWEDQSGSFLLWNIWHVVLGWCIILRAKKWEAPVMTVVNFAQFCIGTMLIGIYIGGTKIGANPFILFREQMPNLPLFTNPDYLSIPRVRDGNDLNALLQNYWMVIHPPVLFLGFASTIIPFAFAYAGLVNKDHSWTRISLSWAGFSGAVLGVGIMMGAAWAYESLSFGGYWAWDPVENASLVPWLVMVAGLHTNLVYRHSEYSLRSTYLFYILAFSLVLYSTFLTRSGILGDSSVHAFTGADMTTQLALFVLVFFLPGMYLFFKERKNIPTIAREENTYSREFWMFIGALVLLLAGIIIIAKTSTPVVNKVFGTSIADPEDPKFAHNQIQIFIAIIIGVLTAITQYFKYKATPKGAFWKKIMLPTIIAVVISASISAFGGVNYNEKGIGFLVAIHLGIFASVYAVVANAGYIWLGMNGKIKAAGASVAHVGFGLVLLGILISSSKKTVLSWNTTGITPLQAPDPKQKNSLSGDPAENITLFKGIRTDMGKYHVTYQGDSLNQYDRKKYFQLLFEDKATGKAFALYPDIMRMNKGQEEPSANPDAKHYWNRDVFVYITSWIDGNKKDTAGFVPRQMKVGDTVFYSNGMIVLNKVNVNPADNKLKLEPNETAMVLDVTVISKEGTRYQANPGVAISQNAQNARSLPDTVVAQNLALQFNRVIDEKEGKLELGIKEDRAMNTLLTAKVYEFPFIFVLWIGVIVMAVGFVMSMWQRIKRDNKLARA